MNVYPVIMAGGVGSRFWPLSRKKSPKQFLPIISRQTMIEETVQRLLPKVPYSRIHTIANADQTQVIKSLLPEIPETNLIVEPMGKNTAPSLLLATAVIFLKDPEATVAALPADHLIQDPSRFLAKLEAGDRAASEGDDLITFGIPPTYPSTGYGYIQIDKTGGRDVAGEEFFPVLAFKEKPDAATASSFLGQGQFFWNSGMFLWRASVFAQKLEQYAPDMYAYWTRLLDALSEDGASAIPDLFNDMPSISIDYALMEKAEGVMMCRGDFGWSDVGAWSALYEIWSREDRGNAVRGDVITLESSRCLVYSPDKLTALVGVEDIIVVDTPDALLVCRTDQDQRIKDVVDLIRKKGREDHL